MNGKLIALYLILGCLQAQAQEATVRLFEEPHFRGPSIEVTADIADLSIVRLDRIGSIQVPRGYKVELFEARHFQGIAEATQHDLANLHRNFRFDPGSIRITWLGADWPDLPADTTAGITLFSEPGFKGDYQVFSHDQPKMRDTWFGNNRAASVLVPPGWSVMLCGGKRYNGRVFLLQQSVDDLDRTPIRRDRVSSILVFAPGQEIAHPNHVAYPYDPALDVALGVALVADDDDVDDVVAVAAGVALLAIAGKAIADEVNDHRVPGAGVTLFTSRNYRGHAQTMRRYEVRKLRRTRIGNDQLSSLRIPPGYEVVLYEHDNFRGRQLVLTDDIDDLDRTGFGVCTASSMKIRYIGN